ncbi:MAG: hypothetical protein JW751_15310 [Polyangiaceae bacterium]|nr:hypothetical protein [Polyangiaceae bacterium]
MNRAVPLVWLGIGWVAIGCMAPVGSQIRIPPGAAATCAKQCDRIGMTLRAVAIMANSVGCVCLPATSGRTAVATTAGMATILMQEQARQQQAVAGQSFN